MDDSYRALLDRVATPVFVLEPDENNLPVYTVFNQSAQDVSGLTLTDVIGNTAKEIFPEPYGEVVYRSHLKALESKHPLVYEVILLVEGTPALVRTHVHPEVDSEGQIISVVGSSQVIDQTIETNTPLQAKELKELEAFINLAAHDLRSPINNIHRLLDYLREGFNDLGDGKIEVLDHLENVSNGALRMIGDLLNHAQTISSPVAIEPFDLPSICEDIAMLFDPARKHLLDIAPIVLHGDRMAVQVILRNLFDNAIKHNPDTQLTLTVSATQSSKNFFSIDFSDDGKGIEDPLTMFTPLRAVGSKAGYGLIAIQKLIHSRGGSIIANSDQSGQHGVTVTFSLPGKLVRTENEDSLILDKLA